MKARQDKRILVIDGQGGGVGKAIVEKLRENFPNLHIIACGTNVIATNAMLKAGADEGATGPSAIVYNAEKSNIILGVMGIVVPFSMLGEYTPEMAEAVSKSDAVKILIPMQKCNIRLAVSDDGNLSKSLALLIEAVQAEISLQ